VTAYLARRFVYYVMLLVVAVCISYLLASTALDPRAYFAGRRPPPSPEAVNAQLTALGINDRTPLTRRLWQWFTGVLHGDFGRTIDGSPVGAEFTRRLGVSLRLLLSGTVLGTVVGVLAGAWTAVRQYRFSDRAVTLTSFLLLSTPTFLLAVLLQIWAVKLNAVLGTDLIQFTGEEDPGLHGGLWAVLRDRGVHLLLPTLSIGLVTAAAYSRYQRNTMLDVLGADYLRTARAKGLSRGRALLKHGLRTALIPMSTYFSYGFLTLFTGATFTEIVFGWHGMAEWLVESIGTDDVNSVVAVSAFTAAVVLLSGFLADVLNAVLDPRVRV
jgi:peptide/nickel transport system permease protein